MRQMTGEAVKMCQKTQESPDKELDVTDRDTQNEGSVVED